MSQRTRAGEYRSLHSDYAGSMAQSARQHHGKSTWERQTAPPRTHGKADLLHARTSRAKYPRRKAIGELAGWLRSGLQIRRICLIFADNPCGTPPEHIKNKAGKCGSPQNRPKGPRGSLERENLLCNVAEEPGYSGEIMEPEMVDTVSSEKRSEMMARIRSKDTGPEMRVRSTAHALGLRFRLHRRDLPGTPDLVFPKFRVAVFVQRK